MDFVWVVAVVGLAKEVEVFHVSVCHSSVEGKTQEMKLAWNSAVVVVVILVSSASC